MSIASFFKPAGGSSSGAKRPREEENVAATAASLTQPLPQPRTLCAWNANSLLNRIEKDKSAVAEFLTTDAPDLILVTEVRMPAAGPAGCKKDDGKPRRRSEISKATAAQAREADVIASFLRTHNYRAYYTLSDSKYAGTALLVRRDRAQPDPASLRYTLSDGGPPGQHTVEGRVIRCSFADFELLGTYAPNNGVTETSFAKRRAWDSECDALLRAHRAAAAKPLVWLGDLNVAAGWHDVGPDPDWFRNANGQTALHADDKGQPGFTANEQTRFAALLDVGGLTDVYRHLHPTANWQIDATWRGTPGVNNPAEGRYYNKGMRIDYVLTSASLVPRIRRAVVHGKGPERRGFLGSDHCPLLVELDALPSEGVASEASEGMDEPDEAKKREGA